MAKVILIAALLIGFVLLGMAYVVIDKKLEKLIRANNKEIKRNGEM